MHFYTCTQIHGHSLTPLIQSTPTQFDITLTEGMGVERRNWRREEGNWKRDERMGGERKGWEERSGQRERKELEERGRDGRRERGNWRIDYDYGIVVGMFTTGELSDMCVRCLRQYVQS